MRVDVKIFAEGFDHHINIGDADFDDNINVIRGSSRRITIRRHRAGDHISNAAALQAFNYDFEQFVLLIYRGRS